MFLVRKYISDFRPYLIYLSLVALFSIFNTSAFPDRIILINGHELEGYIVEVSDDKLVIETTNGKVAVPKTRIGDILKYTDEENALFKAEMDVQDGKWRNAFLKYQKIAEDESTSTGMVVSSLLKNRQIIIKSITQLNWDDKRLFQQVSENIKKRVPDNTEFQFFIGQVYFEIGDKNKAFDMFATLPSDFLTSDSERRDYLKALLQQCINLMIDRQQYEDALQKIECINCMDSSIGKSFEIILYLHWGRSHREKNEFAEALKIYSERLFPLAPAIAENRINQLISELVEYTRKNCEFLNAIALIDEYVATIPPHIYTQTIGDLSLSYARWLIQEERYSDARKVMARYFEYQNPLVANRLINLAEYRGKAALLEPTDFEGHYELGRFCVDTGLFDEAVNEFEIARESSTYKENATLQIRIIKEKQEIAMFEEAMKLHANQQYARALDLLQDLRKKFPQGALMSDVNSLVRLCEDGLKDEAWRRPYQAEAYFQQAERAFFVNDFDTALDKINTILTLYPETPAAERAKTLQSQISASSRLAHLEGKKEPVHQAHISFNPARVDDSAKLEQEIKSLLGEIRN